MLLLLLSLPSLTSWTMCGSWVGPEQGGTPPLTCSPLYLSSLDRTLWHSMLPTWLARGLDKLWA